jgi:hypothetical protein
MLKSRLYSRNPFLFIGNTLEVFIDMNQLHKSCSTQVQRTLT